MLLEELQEFIDNGGLDDQSSPVSQLLIKELKARDRWKHSAKMVQGKSSADFFEEAWQGMPEFVQEDLEPVKSLKINFLSFDDVKDFSNLINQKVTDKTKSVWYPKQDLIKPSDYRYTSIES
jgi:hypothetical protein